MYPPIHAALLELPELVEDVELLVVLELVDRLDEEALEVELDALELVDDELIDDAELLELLLALNDCELLVDPVPLDDVVVLTVTQAPPAQVWPEEHTVVHDPQWLGSFVSVTQTPLQRAWPEGHAHAACAQVCPAPHAAPQDPQWEALEVRSTQELPHAV